MQFIGGVRRGSFTLSLLGGEKLLKYPATVQGGMMKSNFEISLNEALLRIWYTAAIQDSLY